MRAAAAELLVYQAAAEVERRRRGLRLASVRRPIDRAAYIGDPWKYIRDVLGRTFCAKQEEIVEALEKHARVMLPGGTTLGKSDAVSAYAVYVLDAVAAAPDPVNHRAERGARILLLGPAYASVFNFYSKMLQHAERAEARGFPMPGHRSVDSVLWRCGAGWEVEAISPQVRVGREVAHSVSGRHEGVQIAILEEAQGMALSVVNAVEGMLSAAGNTIAALLNPTESAGPMFQRARGSSYTVVPFSAFEHPNVVERRSVIPEAVSHKVIDGRVRLECQDRGPYPKTYPDISRGEFLYALPPSNVAEDPAPRPDGIPGHRDGEIRVYRPRSLFESQVLGRWALNVEVGLFNPGAWDAGVERWKVGKDPAEAPDRIGVDAAREGDDRTCFCPSWGQAAEILLRAWAAGQKDEKGSEKLLALQVGSRIRVGEIRDAPKGRGPEVAKFISSAFPAAQTVWYVDEGGVGTSVYDHARDVLGRQARPVSFSGSPPERLPEEEFCENVRAALYVRARMLVDRGLVDPPDDPQLREEVMAHRLIPGDMVVRDQDGIRRSVQSVRVLEKDEVRRLLGRSPDKSDAFVLSLWGAAFKSAGVLPMPFGRR